MALIAEQLLNMKFVQEVEKHPCLYKTDMSSYLRKDITEEAWKRVSEVVNIPVHICKDKWKNIRVVFVRYLRAMSTDKKKRKPYYLYDLMQFWAPYAKINVPVDEINLTACDEPLKIKIENDSRNLNEKYIKSEFIDESSDNTYQHKKQRVTDGGDGKKRVRTGNELALSKASDPIVSFLNSLLPELDDMSQVQFNIFKRRALGLIDNIKGCR